MRLEEKVDSILEQRDMQVLRVVCSSDAAESLQRMIEFIAKIGNVGHSFGIVVDPDGDETETFGFE